MVYVALLNLGPFSGPCFGAASCSKTKPGKQPRSLVSRAFGAMAPKRLRVKVGPLLVAVSVAVLATNTGTRVACIRAYSGVTCRASSPWARRRERYWLWRRCVSLGRLAARFGSVGWRRVRSVVAGGARQQCGVATSSAHHKARCVRGRVFSCAALLVCNRSRRPARRGLWGGQSLIERPLGQP